MASRDPYEYGTNWFHQWFPPEHLVRWRTHQLRSFLRLIPFVLSPLLLMVPTFLLNTLIFGVEMNWIWVLVGILPGFVALLGVLVLAGAFVKAVFGLGAWRQGFEYATLCMFGPPWPRTYPYAIITEGRVRENDQNKFIVDRQLGGPGNLIIFNDSAVVLERHGRVSRVQGPGATFLERFERIREIMDLRPQMKTVSDAVSYTRDGIAVTTDITVRFRIQHSTSASVENPYPVAQAALEAATKSEAIRVGSAPRSRFDWKSRVMGNVDSTLRGIVAGKYFDELFEAVAPNEGPRDEIGRQMTSQLRKQSESFGVDILEVMLGPFKPVQASIDQQRLANWLTAQRANARVKAAQGEAQALLARETAYAYAQLEMVLAIDRGFHQLVKQDQRLPSRFVALRFVEMLRRMASSPGVSPLLPQESVRTLVSLSRLLTSDK